MLIFQTPPPPPPLPYVTPRHTFSIFVVVDAILEIFVQSHGRLRHTKSFLYFTIFLCKVRPEGVRMPLFRKRTTKVLTKLQRKRRIRDRDQRQKQEKFVQHFVKSAVFKQKRHLRKICVSYHSLPGWHTSRRVCPK